jgi:uncharacterized protein YwlG (UPF0340 family)
MTREEIIKLAREVGSIDSEEVIETVYAAISAAERNRILVLASDACRSFGKAGAVLMAGIRAKALK